MYNKITISKLLILVAVVISGACTKKTGPIVRYDSKFQNVGTIQLNKPYHGQVAITNKGDEPLELEQITSDCECTIIKDFAKSIAPNETRMIKYDLTPHITGYDQQNIFIKNNSKNESTVLFAIRAKVEM